LRPEQISSGKQNQRRDLVENKNSSGKLNWIESVQNASGKHGGKKLVVENKICQALVENKTASGN
jgi:hypothetical protein